MCTDGESLSNACPLGFKGDTSPQMGATPAGTLSYTYDAVRHVASISSSNANGASMSYTYQGRLSTVIDNRLPAGHNTTTYTYDDAYNVGTVTFEQQGLLRSLKRLLTVREPAAQTRLSKSFIYQHTERDAHPCRPDEKACNSLRSGPDFHLYSRRERHRPSARLESLH